MPCISAEAPGTAKERSERVAIASRSSTWPERLEMTRSRSSGLGSVLEAVLEFASELEAELMAALGGGG